MANEKPKFWEKVKVEHTGIFQPSEYTYRTHTPEGWVVSYKYFCGEGRTTSALAYIPDKKNEWILNQDTEWECVFFSKSVNDRQLTYRMKVPNGWLVRDGYYSKWKHLSLKMVFVPDPDPDRKWEPPGKEENDESNK